MAGNSKNTGGTPPKKKLARSPLAPARFPSVAPVAGVRLAGRAVGLKKHKGVKDLMVAAFAPGTTAAGVLTRSKCPSAPVEWCRTILPRGRARALVVNSGNANAFTGNAGDLQVAQTAAEAAHLFGCRAQDVFLASTGVIGEPRAPDYIAGKLPQMKRALGEKSWKSAAEAIMTTDTFPKAASRKVKIGKAEVTLSGFAKGSGMIAPDMATMLAFVFTDAKIPAKVLQRLVRTAADDSFNAITVDSDTSTSDTVLLFATGQAKGQPRIASAGDSALADFKAALKDIFVDLAQQIVRDGEGAQKFVTINVTGAESKRAARTVGLAIANSPLVKTAIAGEDPNWGRIVMAVGKAGEKADRDRLSIGIGDTRITENGQLVAGYDEAPVAAYMKGDEITIDVDLGIGRGRGTVWTCDLTHGYITINADYRS
ncbi:MAG: bifunctional glutamate N-acetyltransferase/amino-acid acetyltransferase ArgJ [Alphaproteobacteria bacterium]|nr:bifunctional glutamate N-acetyltransferase/amino-acid acetyltransferase ArgJ [Alphaproteobacteria bacterium]